MKQIIRYQSGKKYNNNSYWMRVEEHTPVIKGQQGDN